MTIFTVKPFDDGYFVEVKNLSTKVVELKVIDKFIPID